MVLSEIIDATDGYGDFFYTTTAGSFQRDIFRDYGKTLQSRLLEKARNVERLISGDSDDRRCYGIREAYSLKEDENSTSIRVSGLKTARNSSIHIDVRFVFRSGSDS